MSLTPSFYGLEPELCLVLALVDVAVAVGSRVTGCGHYHIDGQHVAHVWHVEAL